ncbi:MAG: ABC transporter ATP-binding protein [Pseudomonadota bacterium]
MRTILSILTSEERRSLLWLLPLICVRGFADMLGVALVFPFLTMISDPGIIQRDEYLSWIYDAGGFSTTDGFVVFVGGAFVLMVLFTAALKIVTVYCVNVWLEHRVHSLSHRLLATYLRQPYSFILTRNSNELVANMLSEVSRIVVDVFKPLTDVILAIVTLMFIIGLLIVVDPLVTFLAIGILGGLYAILFAVVRVLASRLGERLVAANRMRFRIAGEALAGGKQVRLLNRERALLDSYGAPSLMHAHANAKARLLRQTPRYVIEAIAIGGTVVLMLSLLSQNGGIGSESTASTLPLLGVFLLAGYRMMPALQNGYQSIVSLRVGSKALDVLRADLAHADMLPNLPQSTVKPKRLQKGIELRNVSFAYPGSEVASLRNINMTIPCGASIGIVGQTGAGKTTIMDLLLGLLLPSDGQFLVDGKELDDNEIRAWRANIGYVPQDLFLSDATLAQNIAFGIPNEQIDPTRLSEAAQAAQIEEFVLNELPDGFDTIVGERGVRLSGGQRQRISIARALYTRPGVIAFDEATSALDNETEARVMDQITSIAGTRTLIMVAHRLTTVRNCDTIVVMSNGEIEKITTYDQLTQLHAFDCASAVESGS